MVADFRFKRGKVEPLARESIVNAKKITAQVMKEIFKNAEKQAKTNVMKVRPGLKFGSESPAEQVKNSITALGPVVEKNKVHMTLGSYSASGKLGVEATRDNKGIGGSPFNFAVALNVGISAFKLSWVGGALGNKKGGIGIVEPANWLGKIPFQAVTSETVHPGYTATGYLTKAFDFIDSTIEGKLIKGFKGI